MISLSKIRSDISFYRGWKAVQYGFAILLALLIAAWAFKAGDKIPMLLSVACLGLIVVLFCYAHLETGFYLVVGLGFVVADVERYFMDAYPLTSVLLAIPYLLICLLLFKKMRKKDFKELPWHPVIFLYFLLTAYLIVEIFNPRMNSLLGWLSAFWQKLAYLFLLFISCYIFKDLKSVRFFFKFFIGAVFLTALYGCLQQWFGLTSFDHRWVYDNPIVAALYSLPGSGLRKFSSLTDPANFGTLMAAGALATLVLLVMGPFQKRSKILLGIFTVIMLLGMSYSGTRTANLMLVAGIALYILMTIYQKKTKIFAISVGMIFLFILYAPIYGNITLNRFRTAFTSRPSENASYETRLIHRRMMQPYMHEHPLGGGVNTSGVPGRKYNPHHFLAGFPPDGAYFSIALETGWVGLVLNCIFFFVILFYCVHYFYKCKNLEIKAYYAAMTLFLFSLFLGADAQFTMSPVPQSLIFVPLLAVIAKLHTFDAPDSNPAKQYTQ